MKMIETISYLDVGPDRSTKTFALHPGQDFCHPGALLISSIFRPRWQWRNWKQVNFISLTQCFLTFSKVPLARSGALAHIQTQILRSLWSSCSHIRSFRSRLPQWRGSCLAWRWWSLCHFRRARFTIPVKTARQQLCYSYMPGLGLDNLAFTLLLQESRWLSSLLWLSCPACLGELIGFGFRTISERHRETSCKMICQRNGLRYLGIFVQILQGFVANWLDVECLRPILLGDMVLVLPKHLSQSVSGARLVPCSLFRSLIQCWFVPFAIQIQESRAILLVTVWRVTRTWCHCCLASSLWMRPSMPCKGQHAMGLHNGITLILHSGATTFAMLSHGEIQA